MVELNTPTFITSHVAVSHLVIHLLCVSACMVESCWYVGGHACVTSCAGVGLYICVCVGMGVGVGVCSYVSNSTEI